MASVAVVVPDASLMRTLGPRADRTGFENFVTRHIAAYGPLLSGDAVLALRGAAAGLRGLQHIGCELVLVVAEKLGGDEAVR